MRKKPRRGETIYGFTIADLAEVAGIGRASLDAIDCSDLDAVMAKIISIREKRSRLASMVPDDNPRNSRKPPLPSFFASFSLVYAHGDAEKNHRLPRPGDLEHAATQLRTFGFRAKVVDHWVQVGQDLFCLLDARRILAIAEAIGRSPARSLYSRCLATLSHAALADDAHGASASPSA